MYKEAKAIFKDLHTMSRTKKSTNILRWRGMDIISMPPLDLYPSSRRLVTCRKIPTLQLANLSGKHNLCWIATSNL